MTERTRAGAAHTDMVSSTGYATPFAYNFKRN